MTLSTQTSKAAFSGNGVSATFPLPFPFLRDADIKALLRQEGFETPLEAGVHYTLTGAGSAAVGSLVMHNPPATGQTLVVYRAPAIVQEVDYVENSAFPAETHEAALDLLTMICQSLQEQIGRAVLYPVSTPAGDILDSSTFLASTSQSREAARISEQNAAASAGQAAAAASVASASATAAEALAATADGLLKVSMSDAKARTLSAKLLAGNGLAEGIENPGGEEALRLAVALAASPGLEFDAGLLRVRAGTGLTLSASGLAADVGTGAGKLVQLDASGRIPAVSGALLTGLSALAKLALSANKVLYMDSAGAPQLLAFGAAGTVLKSQGAAAAPVFATAGGRWEYVSKATAATSAYLAFTGLDVATYDYRLEIHDLIFANSAATPLMQMGTGAGPTYLTTGYSGPWMAAAGGDPPIAGFIADATPFIGRAAAATQLFHGVIDIHQGSGLVPCCDINTYNYTGSYNTGPSAYHGGLYNTTTATITALKLLLTSSVNISSGFVVLYRKEKK